MYRGLHIKDRYWTNNWNNNNWFLPHCDLCSSIWSFWLKELSESMLVAVPISFLVPLVERSSVVWLDVWWLMRPGWRVLQWWMRQGGCAIHIFSRHRPESYGLYLFVLSFEVDLFCVGTGCTVDAGIMDAAEHEHLVVGFIAEVASFTYFVHFILYIN